MFTLPELPYGYSELEPHISNQTLQFHHDKHHAGYVAKLNAALEGMDELLASSIESVLLALDTIPEDRQKAVLNNGGQHYNHSLYWLSMSPRDTEISIELANSINNAFGTYEKFAQEFAQSGAGQFGSGWTWLSYNPETQKVEIESTLNADTPLLRGKKPLLVMDVWEHAYYLDYQNLRADYIAGFLKIVNWEHASTLFQEATQG